MDPIKQIIEKLPWLIDFEGCQFEFVVLHHINDMRLCYCLESADPGSMHYNDFNEHGCWDNPFYFGKYEPDNRHPAGFLFLIEGITSMDELTYGVLQLVDLVKLIPNDTNTGK